MIRAQDPFEARSLEVLNAGKNLQKKIRQEYKTMTPAK